MELDHFRPKAKFAELVNDPTNLVWACAECNGYKSDHWPAEGTPGSVNGEEGFIDPFSEDRNEYMAVESDGSLTALKAPARYVIELLHLNRACACLTRTARDNAHRIVPQLDRAIAEIDRILPRQDLPEEIRTALLSSRTLHVKSRGDAMRRLDFSLH